MTDPSVAVRSSQTEVHPRLREIVLRHLSSQWQQPFHVPTVAAFARLRNHGIVNSDAELILDSGCGTGESTRRIAQAFPNAVVIGVDRSASRLKRLDHDGFPHVEGNAVWVQGELATFWRLLRQEGWRLKRHYLLYPNPWPKPGQLQRRWHAHPVFGEMLALGGALEMRCNWKIYAEEFSAALDIAFEGRLDINLDSSGSEDDWSSVVTPFGRKYARSGHRLYRVWADIRGLAQGLLDDPVK